MKYIKFKTALQGKTQEEDDCELSRREREILNLVLEGITSKEIGKKLSISARTAETHRFNIMKKFGCSNIVGLVKCSIERKLF